MPYNQINQPNRQSIRLRGYNYSSPGIYFITICTQNRKCLFGNVINDKMKLNEYGIIASKSWEYLQQQYTYIKLDTYIIMPNHLHGIIIITCRGGSRTARDITCTEHNGEHNIYNEMGITHNKKRIICDKNTDDLQIKNAGGSRTAPTIKHKPLGQLIGVFKTVSTKHINKLRIILGVSVWQRNYHEHIIRNEIELQKIRQYIKHNPLTWHNDNCFTQV